MALVTTLLLLSLMVAMTLAMVIADSPHAERMCKEHGMTKLKSPVYITQ